MTVLQFEFALIDENLKSRNFGGPSVCAQKSIQTAEKDKQ